MKKMIQTGIAILFVIAIVISGCSKSGEKVEATTESAEGKTPTMTEQASPQQQYNPNQMMGGDQQQQQYNPNQMMGGDQQQQQYNPNSNTTPTR